jgi:hypothetical protein
MMNEREAILDAEDLERVEVEVPEWGVTVYVSELGGRDAEDFFHSMRGEDGKPKKGFRERLLLKTLFNAEGDRIFTDDDEAALGGKKNAVIERLFEAAMKLNVMSDEAVELAEKNLESVPS